MLVGEIPNAGDLFTQHYQLFVQTVAHLLASYLKDLFTRNEI